MIAPEHGNPDASIRATDLSKIGIAELLFFRRDPAVKAKWIADILDRLIWMTDDNGDTILAELRAWLDCEDALKVEVALCLEDVFLWQSDAEMHQITARICDRFSELTPLCNRRVSAWRAQFPRGRPAP